MSKPVNRALVEELLADESLSYKEIARQADCSDWSVRSIDRERSGGPPMKTPRSPRHVDESEFEEPPRPLTGTEKAIACGVVALIVIGVVALGWYVRRDDFPPYYPPEEPMT
jgi:hypothetical protein